MRARKSDNALDLTNAESALLRGSTVPAEIKTFVSRSHDSIGTRVTAYGKIAAAARAERLALQEVGRLYMAREAVTEESEYRAQIRRLEEQTRLLTAENERTRAELMRSVAVDAVVVHSND